MTVQSEVSRNDYIGNGATATYTYSFRIFAATDLLVTRVDLLGVETALAYPTDYSVTGVGSFGGGTITLTAGNLTTGYGLTLRFDTLLTQGTDLRNQGGFFPEVIEDALDRLTRIDQQQQDELDRGLRLPETEAGTAALRTLPPSTARASKFLGFDASGNPIAAAGTSANLGPVSAFVDTLLDDVDGAHFVETLRDSMVDDTVAPVSADEVLVRESSSAIFKRMTVATFIKAITEGAVTFSTPTGFNSTVSIVGALTAAAGATITGDAAVTHDLTVTNNLTVSNIANSVSGYKLNGTVLPIQRVSTTTPITLVAGAQTVFSHGLGVVPALCNINLVCQIAEGGYVAGDIVPASTTAIESTVARGFAVKLSSTAVTVTVGGATNSIALLNLATGAVFLATNANWKYYIQAYA